MGFEPVAKVAEPLKDRLLDGSDNLGRASESGGAGGSTGSVVVGRGRSAVGVIGRARWAVALLVARAFCAIRPLGAMLHDAAIGLVAMAVAVTGISPLFDGARAARQPALDRFPTVTATDFDVAVAARAQPAHSAGELRVRGSRVAVDERRVGRLAARTEVAGAGGCTWLPGLRLEVGRQRAGGRTG